MDSPGIAPGLPHSFADKHAACLLLAVEDIGHFILYKQFSKSSFRWLPSCAFCGAIAWSRGGGLFLYARARVYVMVMMP